MLYCTNYVVLMQDRCKNFQHLSINQSRKKERKNMPAFPGSCESFLTNNVQIDGKDKKGKKRKSMGEVSKRVDSTDTRYRKGGISRRDIFILHAHTHTHPHTPIPHPIPSNQTKSNPKPNQKDNKTSPRPLHPVLSHRIYQAVQTKLPTLRYNNLGRYNIQVPQHQLLLLLRTYSYEYLTCTISQVLI